MANLFRGRLARTEGAHFAKEERRLVQDAAERLRRAAGAEAAARRGAIARAAAANAPAPTVDVLPEVSAHTRLFRPPARAAPDFRALLGLAAPQGGSPEQRRADALREAARRGKEQGQAYYAAKRAAAEEARAAAEYAAGAPLRVAGGAFFWGTALAIGSFGAVTAAFCSYYGIWSIEQMQHWTKEDLRPWARRSIGVPLGVAAIVDGDDEEDGGQWAAAVDEVEAAGGAAAVAVRDVAADGAAAAPVATDVPSPPEWRPYRSDGAAPAVVMQKSPALSKTARDIKGFFRKALGVRPPADAATSHEEAAGGAAAEPQKRSYGKSMF